MLIIKSEDFFIGKIKEIPSVFTQGISIKGTEANILDALNLYLADLKS